MVSTALDFILKNNILVIQVLFGAIFLFVVFLILRSFREEKEKAPAVVFKEVYSEPLVPQSKEVNPLDGLDKMDLNKILAEEQGESSPSMPPPSEAKKLEGGEESDLKKTLEEKDKVIQDLRAEIAQIQSKATGGASPDVESKIEELTQKLAEYEIIEDDIANLSFYKGENVRLKNELAKLRGEPLQEVEPEVAPPPPPTPNQEIAPTAKDNPEDNTVEEALRAMENPLESDSTKDPAPNNPDDSIMKEFEQAIQSQEATEGDTKTEVPKAEAPKTMVPSDPEEEAVKTSQKTSSESPKGSQKGNVQVSEEKSRTLLEEKGASEKGKNLPEASQENLDSKKADSKETGSAGASSDDENAKLIEEFENFVNKG